MKIIDLHCDTMMWHNQTSRHVLQDKARQVGEEKLKKGQALAQCFALFVPVVNGTNEEEQIDDCYQRYNYLYHCYQRDLTENKDWLSAAVTAEDIKSNENRGKISAILTLEDGTFLGDSLKRLEEAYQRGARVLGLTWNTENKIGYPNAINAKNHMKGLKEFGFELIDKMNQMGMIIDVSHLSEGGFWDVARCSKQPFVATHSCARAICEHQRNLTDKQLKAIGEAGGIVGVNFLSLFLRAESHYTSIEDVVLHMKHIVNVSGIETAAFGSDFDGMVDSELEFEDYSGYQKIVDALLKEFTESEVEKICHQNALRVFGQCCR